MDYNKTEQFENELPEIHSLIQQKEFEKAQQMFDKYSLDDNAKWHYHYALLRYSQGWMEEAYHHYKKAYKLEKDNLIYREAFEKIYEMRYPKKPKQKLKEIFRYSCIALSGFTVVSCIGFSITFYIECNQCGEDCNNCPG